MTEEEIYEELEITYGKPLRTTSEKNMIWLESEGTGTLTLPCEPR